MFSGLYGRKPNIIFVAIDDLNDWIEPLGGYPGIVTPSLTRLAAMGTTCLSAQVAAPACSPSRAATLTGLSPHRSGIYFNKHHWDDSPLAHHDTLIGHLHNGGYKTRGCGKVFHQWKDRLRDSDWDEYFLPDGYMDSINDRNNNISKMAKRWLKRTGKESNEDFGPSRTGSYGDKHVTDWALQKMQDPAWREGGQFLAIGLYRPHLPFVVGRRYFDLYPEVPSLPPGFYPGSNRWEDSRRDLDDLPPTGVGVGRERLGRDLQETGEYDDFVRGYLASTSFADHQIGRILKLYERLGLSDNTYIVLWSDHGWQLGEKLKFRKFTLWERALRVPLFFAGPGIPPGSTIADPVSLLSVYPTISELAGAPIPDHCDGISIAQKLLGNSREPLPPSVSFWGNEKLDDSFECYMSVRTADWRLIDYRNGDVELYDHRTDRFEWYNLANPPRRAEVNTTIDMMRRYLPTTLASPAIPKGRRRAS